MTGVQVSRMCLGTMMFAKRTDPAEADRILSFALDQGVNFLDTAPMYSEGACEELLGRILQGRRDKVFLATKVHKGVDRESILGSIDESLRRLQTDRVDLYLIHWPKAGMKLEEIMRALNDVVRAGKARYVGCCNYPAWMVEASNGIAALRGWSKLVCNQIPYNPVERGAEVEVLPQARAGRVAITVYRPILQGLLAGKYDPDQPLPADSRAESDERIGRWLQKYAAGVRFFLNFAREKNVPPGAVAMAWLMGCPAVTCPIVGPSRFAHVEEAVKSFDFEITSAEREAISNAFDAGVKEETGGKFPELRRTLDLVCE
jgi:aryl-alcohol dehydrogenase-like predicted oxidoreductase